MAPGRLHLTTDTGYDATETVLEVRRSERFEPGLFSRPSELASGARFLSGGRAAKIPITLEENHIYLRASLNGSKPAWFALDTGASRNVLDSDAARSTGLKTTGRTSLTGAGGITPASYARGVELRVGDVVLPGQTFLVSPLTFMPPIKGEPVAGILGFDLFDSFVVELDYEGSEVTIHESLGFRYGGRGAAIPITLHAEQPYVRARIRLAGGTEIDGEHIIDLGFGRTLMLARDFVDKHGVMGALGRTVSLRGAGVGGEFEIVVGRIQALEVGPFRMDRPLALLPPGQITAAGKAGNIGAGFLSRFRVIFDYERMRMILEPNKRLAEPEEFDMSGLRLAATNPPSSRVRIDHVYNDSPAMDAGIRAGDHLVKVNGRAAGDYAMGELRALLRQERSKVDLVVESGSSTRNVTLTLRRLV
jgi:hypothetical protein